MSGSGTVVCSLCVSLSLNWSVALLATMATLFKAGAYTFRVTIKDVPGLTVTSDVTVTVNPLFSSITVSPAGVSIANGATQQYTAVAKDQFNNPLATQPAFTWSLGAGSVGTLSSTGLYTAPVSGAGSATVIATSGSITGSTSAGSFGSPCTPRKSSPPISARWRTAGRSRASDRPPGSGR